MEGVEILDTVVQYEIVFNTWPLIVCLIVGSIIGFCLGFFEDYSIASGIIGVILAAIIFGAFGLILCAFTAEITDNILYIEYKVTVSDDVTLNEFFNTYEIIEKEGNIFTVRQKHE